MGTICNKLSSLLKPSNKPNNLDLDYCNYNNNTINNNRIKNVPIKNVPIKNMPTLDISNAIISLNNEDEEPPSYREVRNEGANFYKKTMLFNGFSDTLIARPRM